MSPEQRWEKEDSMRWEAAVRKLHSDPDLRFFLRILLQLGQYGQNTFHTNALTTAHVSGKQALVQDLFALVTEQQPTFLPELLMEDLDERANREHAERTANHH